MDFSNSSNHLTNPGAAAPKVKASTDSLAGFLKAKYDAAQWTPDNLGHWSNASSYGPNVANNPAIRERLRNRSRYEGVENNSYLKGIILSIANDFVCSGPSLQITDQRLSDAHRQLIEHRFNNYAKTIHLRQLLWRLRHARCVDGEGFALQFTDNAMGRVPSITLDDKGKATQTETGEVFSNWQVIEAEQCSSLLTVDSGSYDYNYEVDGIRFDRNMRPVSYFILYTNPYDEQLYTNGSGTDRWGRWIPARHVVHWTRQERPWLRGIPETTQALPLCAYLRRYNLAVLSSAEFAASLSGILSSPAPPSTTSDLFGVGAGSSGPVEDQLSPFEAFQAERGMFIKLPDDNEIHQLKAEQPTENHGEFIDTVIREIARAMMVPFNVATGFSGGYNFASGTLDRQLYNGNIARDRDHCEDYVLPKILDAWWVEAVRMPTYLGFQTTFDAYRDKDGVYRVQRITPEFPEYRWRWDVQPEHADPSKVADSLVALWEAGFLTDDQIMMERFNRDPQEHYASLKRQADNRKKLGMPLPGVTLVEQNTSSNNTPTNSAPSSNKNQQNGKGTKATPTPQPKKGVKASATYIDGENGDTTTVQLGGIRGTMQIGPDGYPCEE